MTWWQRVRRAGELERELDAEVRYHFDRRVDDHVNAGMARSEALRRTRLEFGGLDQIKEECRDARGTRWVSEIAQDVRFAARRLAKRRWLTLAMTIAERLTAPRAISVLMSALGALALALAAIGLYGVIAYLVSQRTHEIGLRLVLGATRGDVFRLVFGDASRLTLAGVAIGALLALSTARVVEAVLVDIASVQLTVFLGLVVIVSAVGLAAAYLPARRALKIEPAIALRNE